MSRALKLQQALARHLRIAALKGKSMIKCNTYKDAKRLQKAFYTFIRYLGRVEQKSPGQRKFDEAAGMMDLVPIRENIYVKLTRKPGDRGELLVEYKDNYWLRKALEDAAALNEQGILYDSENLRKKMCADDSFWLDDED